MRHAVRAIFDERSIRVYQAFRPEIAEAAVAAGRFVPPFAMGRMTWIKPSFNWMMYRCGCAAKPGQERVLAVDTRRDGFAWALEHAALSHHDPAVHPSHDAWRTALDHAPVRIQWDPERDDRLQPNPAVRSIQIGLSGEAVRRYVEEWTVRITDVTALALGHGAALRAGSVPDDPVSRRERPYPIDPAAFRAVFPPEP